MTSLSLTSRIILTLCFLALLAIVSLMPARSQSGNSAFMWLVANTPSGLQKLLHFCLYGVLVLLLAWTLDGIQSTTHRLLLAWMIAVSFGAVMEWYQTKVPGRFGSVTDVALNAVGAAFGLLAALFLL